MNIKTTLLTLIIGSLACLTVLPVQADASRNRGDKYEEHRWRNQQGDQDEDQSKSRKTHKQPSVRPRKEESPRVQPRRDRNENTVQDVKKARPVDQRPVKRLEKDRHDRPITLREQNRYEQPAPVRVKKMKRQTKPVATVERPRHRIEYRHDYRPRYRYIRGPWYYTRYISPLPRYYYPFGFHINVLPSPYVRIVIGGYPYFYYSGVYYQSYRSGYVVVRAPIGAFITSLPEGFIAFTIGLATYYYVNDTYYAWDDQRGGYIVVDKPAGATEAIEKATAGRLVVYPNHNQNEEQQAKDRYECHRWAVAESGFDPTLEEEEYSEKDNDVYRRAIAACLEGRDYTVK